MHDPRGFMTLKRASPAREPASARVRHWREFYEPLSETGLKDQGKRCMDCGVPFCQSDTGCPVRNDIPEWNDLVALGRWRDALESLHSTNNFPEFTGRLCPAPCESACVLGLIEEPVSIRNIEQAIADRGFREGWVTPAEPAEDSGRRVAVIGSGPAGLAAAQQLRRDGHAVVVFERDDRIGGLLRYGIPEFKMEKKVLDRRLAQLVAEGVVLRSGVKAGTDLSARELLGEFDAVVLAMGASAARELPVAGRELTGVHQAMTFLTQQNRRDAGDEIAPELSISAAGRHVVIVGGGDTGSDCAGTCHRQGARSVQQFELLQQPPQGRDSSTPWPTWPMQLRSSHAHEEGTQRAWSVLTTAFVGRGGKVRAIRVRRIGETAQADGAAAPTGEIEIDADLILLAMGFTGPAPSKLVAELGVRTDARGNVTTDGSHRTSVPAVYAAGDVRRGASLIVWAIREGRDAAATISADFARTPLRRTR
jgi:glutamate synthase (NADPH/NADH) small chain